MLYFACVLCTMNAILVLYLNMFRPREIFRGTCYGMMAFITIYLTLFLFLWASVCSRVAKVWHLVNWHGGGFCLNVYAQNYAAGAINISSDMIILIMPLPLLKGLQRADKVMSMDGTYGGDTPPLVSGSHARIPAQVTQQVACYYWSLVCGMVLFRVSGY